MVGSKASARASAACLPVNAPCLLANALGILRLAAEIFPRAIGPSWPEFDAWLSAKNVGLGCVQKNNLVAMLSDGLLRRLSLAPKSRRAGRFRPFQAAQQSLNAGRLPFAVKCRWYLSFVQLARAGAGGDKAPSREFPNCRSQGFGSRLCGLLVCLPIIDPAICNQAKTRKDPRDAGERVEPNGDSDEARVPSSPDLI
jgi:hypothetical protein